MQPAIFKHLRINHRCNSPGVEYVFLEDGICLWCISQAYAYTHLLSMDGVYGFGHVKKGKKCNIKKKESKLSMCISSPQNSIHKYNLNKGLQNYYY